MFKNAFQSGLLSIFYSCGSNPLGIWDMQVQNGHIKRLTDPEVNSIVLEIVSTNVATTYITCPKDSNRNLGIKLPFLVMIVKNLKRYFSFEITVLDDKNMRRRFRISNFQSTTKIRPFCTTMPIGLSGGWNQIQFNLADFTRRAYGSQFIEALRVQVHANTRLRRIYFADRLYTEEELPQDYKLYLPLERKIKKKDEKEVKLAPSKMAAAPGAEGEAELGAGEGKAAEGEPAGEEGAPPAAAPSKTGQSVVEKKPSVMAPAAEGAEAVEGQEGEAPAEGTEATPAEAELAEGEEKPAEGAEGEPAGEDAVEGDKAPEGEAPAEGEAPSAEDEAPAAEGEAPAAEAAPEEAPAAAEAPPDAEAPAEEVPQAE